MSRGNVIVVAALGGFLVTFLVVQVYMWPEWHRNDCGELECIGALMFAVVGGAFAGFCVMIIAGFTAAGFTYWLATRSRAGDAPFDENT